MKQLLQTKIHHPGVWHANGLNEQAIISSGHALLDSALPNGGWQTEVVYEVAAQQQFAVLSLLQATLIQLSHKRQWLVLLSPPRWALDLLAESELASEHLLVVHGKAEFDTLWATEQAVRQGNAACILAWPEEMTARDVQRLKLAARKTESLCFMFPQHGLAQTQGCHLQICAHQSQTQPQLIALPDLEQAETLASNDHLH